MAERIIDQLSPDTRKRYEAYVSSMRGAASPEWLTMAMSIKDRRSLCSMLGTELPETWESVEARISEADITPASKEMYRYMFTNVPFHAEAQLRALKWVFPASWADKDGANDGEAYKEAYLKGFSYFFSELRDEDIKNYAPFSLNYEQQNARFDDVAEEHIAAYMESRYPRIYKKLQQAVKKAVVLLFVADNVDETGIGEIYYIAKKQNGLKTGKALTPKDKKAIEQIAEAVAIVVEFWALNYCKWVACYLWNDEANERQYISEAEADEHNVNAYLFNEVADIFGLFITAYHKAAVAGIQSSGEEYLSTDFEALIPAFTEEWEATEKMGGYNALMDKVKNSRYNAYYTEL